MTTYRTGNPIGSTDPKDLYDNAENTDVFVNSLDREYWDDRFGRNRKTIYGMYQDFQEFLVKSGYVGLGPNGEIQDYAAGLEITERNQVFRYEGELYRAGATLDLPYTTTGDWGTEGSLFVAVGDQALRQELNDDTDVKSGASLVARSTISVRNIPDMLRYDGFNSKSFFLNGFRHIEDGGGGLFIFDQEKHKSEHDGGIVIDPDKADEFDLPGWFEPTGSGTGCFVRVVSGVSLSFFGLVPDDINWSVFNTAAFESAIKFAENKRKVTIYAPLKGDRFYFSGGSGPFPLRNEVSFDGGDKVYVMVQRDGFELLMGEDNKLTNLSVFSDHEDDSEVPGEFFGIKISRGNKVVSRAYVRGFHVGIWIAQRQNSLVENSISIRNNINYRFGSLPSEGFCNFNWFRNCQNQNSYMIGLEALEGFNYVDTMNIENHFQTTNPSLGGNNGGLYIADGAEISMENSWTERNRWINKGTLHLKNMMSMSPGTLRISNNGMIQEIEMMAAQLTRPLSLIDVLGPDGAPGATGAAVDVDDSFYLRGAPFARVRVNGSSGTAKRINGPLTNYRGSYIRDTDGIFGVYADVNIWMVDPIDSLGIIISFTNENGDNWNFNMTRAVLPPTETGRIVNIGGMCELNGWPESFDLYRVRSVRMMVVVGNTNTNYANDVRELRIFPSFIRLITVPSVKINY